MKKYIILLLFAVLCLFSSATTDSIPEYVPDAVDELLYQDGFGVSTFE